MLDINNVWGIGLAGKSLPQSRSQPLFLKLHRPRSCPICGSDLVVSQIIPVRWKKTRLIAPRIEVTEPMFAQVSAWMCGDCGYIISRLYRKGEVTSYGAPEKEAHYLEMPVSSAARFNYSRGLQNADRARTDAYSKANKRYEDSVTKAERMDEAARKHAIQRAALTHQEETAKARTEYNSSVATARITYERSFLHYLVSDKRQKPVFHEVQILEARRIVPPFPMSAIFVKVGQRITYTDFWCDIHETHETVETFTYRTREYTLQELQIFSELIRRKQAAGLTPQAREGALAYLVACQRGTVSFVTGFMRASNFARFRDTAKSTIGQALSRIQSLGLIPTEVSEKTDARVYRAWKIPVQRFPGVKYTYVPVKTVLTEKEYIFRKTAAVQIRRNPRWWTVLDVKESTMAAQELGLEAWL